MTSQESLVPCPAGQYRFLSGIDAYSSRAVAMPGSEITRVTLQAPPPYREGFSLIDHHLRRLGRPRAALCAIELRIPAPLSFHDFGQFNRSYRAILIEWPPAHPRARVRDGHAGRPARDPARTMTAGERPAT
jgi:hypothetical protein